MSARKAKTSPYAVGNNNIPSSSRTPTFKPPSFYAAAAGLKYSSTVDPHVHASQLNSATHDFIDVTEVPHSYPTSYEEDQDDGRERIRSNSFSRPFSRALPRQQRQDRSTTAQNRRKSQMAEIPFLETQLLPSLRDTIDKMTHPQSRSAEVEDISSNPRDGSSSTTDHRKSVLKPSNARIERQGQSSIPSSPYISSRQKYPSSNPVSPLIPSGLSTPRFTSSSIHNTPRVDGQSPARPSSSKLPTGSRNASSLRVNAASSPASVPIPPSPLPGRSPAQSTRTPRLDAIPVSLQPSTSPTDVRRSPNLKLASRLPTPGSTYAASSGSHVRSTPRQRQTSAPFQSIAAQPTRLQPNYLTDSGSELEHEYRQGSSTGRLVVTNADIYPSSSESILEKDSPDRAHTGTYIQSVDRSYGNERWDEKVGTQKSRREEYVQGSSEPRQLQRNDTHRDRNSVGLGFQFGPEQTNEALPDNGVDTYDAERRNRLYQEDRDRSRQQQRKYDISQPEHERDRKGSSVFDGRRRREALLGLVNGLQHEYGVHPVSTYDTLGHEDGDNHNVGGVVVTESMELEGNMYIHSTGDSEDHQHHNRRGNDRSANNTHNSPNAYTEDSSIRSRRDPSGSSARMDESGRDQRSSSMPPRSRSIARPSGASKTRQEPRLGPVSKQAKARHRVSMSMDQSRQPSVRSKRTSGHAQDSAKDVKPTMTRRDSAAREREAFGIPASLSYGGRDDEIPSRTNERQLPRRAPSRAASDTELSTAGDELVPTEGNSEGLSLAAEALFDKLSGTAGSGVDPQRKPGRSRSRQHSANGHNDSGVEEQFVGRANQQQGKQQQRRQSRALSISESASAPSVYEPEPEFKDDSRVSPVQDIGSWRSTMRSKTYERLLHTHGAMEMERQEVVYQYYHNQQKLWQRLYSTVQIFVLPLRRQHSKTWIPGVPTRVGRLFDWLEDIVNLHHAISEALKTVIAAWETGNVVLYVAKTLRAFVPRLEVYQPYLVRYEEVRQMIAERIAMPTDEFGEFIKLQQRRRECEGFALTDLLDLPVSHLSTCIGTFEHLWRLTTSEHPDYIPAFSLYHSTRMIVQVLWEVKVREEEYEYIKSISSRIEGLFSSVQLATRERRLLWHEDVTFHPPDRCNIMNPALAVLSPPSGSSSGRPGAHSTPAIVLSPCPDDGRATTSETTSSSKPLDVRVFVFTDVVVIARKLSKQRSSGAQWKLVPDTGIARIMGMAPPDAVSGRLGLDLLPLKQPDLQSGMIPEDRSVVKVGLSIPSRLAQNDREAMLDAFRRCYAYTLRSLSFPSHSAQYLPHGPHVDLEQDTQKSVMAILNSGLPLPKSPSIQINDSGRAGTADPSTDHDREREERGWWALRFQQVLKEVQRQDPRAALQTISHRDNGL